METISELQFCLILFFVLIISTIFLKFHSKKSIKTLNLNVPPSPPALPLIGHLHLLRPNATKSFHKLSSNHGPFLYLQLTSCPLLLVSSASFASEIFKTNDVSFSGKPRSLSNDSLLFGDSSFAAAPYGQYWRFMKKLCITELLGTQQVQKSQVIRSEEVRGFVKRLLKKASESESVDLGDELMRLTNNIICRMALSTSCSTDDNKAQKVRKLVLDSLDLGGKLCLAALLGPLRKVGFWFMCKRKMEVLIRYFDELFDKIFEEHERRRDGRDLVDILLKVYHDQNAEFKLNKTQIKAFLLDLFIGGTDTAAHAMEWIMAELINHPDVMNKIRNEIKSIVGTERLVEESNIPNLPYFQAVVKELMRLYPVAPIVVRECIEDCKVGEYDIPKGTLVVVNTYSVMRDPEIWENPNKFYPERFLQGQEQTYAQNSSYVPFGGGRRMCPGLNLALAVVNLTVATMVQCFDWKVFSCDGKVSLESKAGIVMDMAHPIVCSPVTHFNPFQHA